MQRFIEQQNIAYLERLLATEATSGRSRHLVQEQLLAARRRLAALDAARAGFRSKPPLERLPVLAHAAPQMARQFHRQFEAAAMPLLLLDPGPGLRIVEANADYATATMIEPGKVTGEKLFDVFPDNPGDPFADGVANLFDSLHIVAETGRQHAMPVQRYDVRSPSGKFVERHWRPVNSPVTNESGELAFILHRVIDVTPPFPRRAG